MKRLVTLAAMAAMSTGLVAPAGAADVGVSVSVSQPGIYGRVDIGRFPQPEIVVAQPVVVAAPRVVVARPVQPVYLWVPPGHQKHWGKHCHRYDACGVPVYFVRDEWYHRHVMVARHDHDDDDGKHKHKRHGGKGHGKGRDHD